MKQAAWVLSMTLAVCSVAFSQDSSHPNRPTLSVTGPAGITPPGELATYTATVGGNVGDSKLTYIWTFTGGAIESGQGTSTIQVRIPDGGLCLAATVKVTGLSKEGPMTASETSCVDPGPPPEKLDQFSWPPDSTLADRLRKIAETVNNNPNVQLYIFTPPDAAIRRAIVDRISKAIPEHNIDGARMTFVDNASRNSSIQVWLVPPGATPPSKCDGCEQPTQLSAPTTCPTLKVIGPPGITQQGGTMTFAVNGAEPFSGEYKWTVSDGTIKSGQGTKSIEMIAPTVNTNVTATVQLVGLPKPVRITLLKPREFI